MNKHEKYKIGVISKLLGIPVQTLHYYEKCGFITPEKDENSGYRYYDAWDINFLLDSKYWQSYEYSTSEVTQMIKTDTTNDIKQRFETQEKILLDKLCYYQNLLSQLKEELSNLKSFEDSLGIFQITQNPILLYEYYRIKNTYQAAKNSTELPRIQEWLNIFPFAQATFSIALDTIKKEEPTHLEYQWGFSIPPQKAKELDFPSISKAKLITSKTCLYTVFEAEDRGTFVSSIFNQVFMPIWEQGYEITSMPIGRLIVRAHDSDLYKRYFEIWVPVSK